MEIWESLKNKINITVNFDLQCSIYQYSGMFYFSLFPMYIYNYKILKMILVSHCTIYLLSQIMPFSLIVLNYEHFRIKNMWHIYTMEYYSAIKRNEIDLFVVRWMDLESVIQSEVSQKEKNKYHMLTHIYGI